VFRYDNTLLTNASDFAIVSGPAKYETCESATAYKKRTDKDETEVGTALCVRTTGHRYAFVKIKKVIRRSQDSQIELDVTVWDPPFE
jgi:hypothetical protein